MRYLEAKALRQQAQGDGGENKMLPGTRPDQTELRRSNPTPQVKGELRQLAERYGVDVDAITGTGTNGEVTREDIKKARKAQDAAKKASGAMENKDVSGVVEE